VEPAEEALEATADSAPEPTPHGGTEPE
jgi:hypothetical protein